MTWLDYIAILIIAGVLAGLLVGLVGWRHTHDATRAEWMPALLFAFTVIVLALWAASLWIVPATATAAIYFSAWISLVVIGALIALIIAAVTLPHRRPKTAAKVAEQGNARGGKVDDDTAAFAFGISFWILVLTFLALIVAGYVYV